MTLKVTPAGLSDGKEYLTVKSALEDKRIPVGLSVAQYYGVFDSVLVAGAATYSIAAGAGDTGIVLTDLVISLEKRVGGTADIYFTDDTNDESIMLISVNDAPANFSVPFVGRWQSWQGARLDVDITNAVSGCISVGYYRTLPANTYAYDAWIAKRSATPTGVSITI